MWSCGIGQVHEQRSLASGQEGNTGISVAGSLPEAGAPIPDDSAGRN